jgi:GT2 family glycosyltransferase
MIAELAQTVLATLTVVDNAPSDASRAAAHSRADVLPTTYIAMNENTGPAGGLAAGMTRVLETAADNDWVITLDDDRLTGSIETPGELRDFGVWLTQKGAPVGAVGQVGSRFDRGHGRLNRLHDDELAGPVSVDYVAGGQLLMLRVAAMRSTGVFDPELFFGFDDLDYCLRLARNGYGIYVYGPAAIEARRRFGRLGEVGSAPRRLSVWRRYYAVRNHIVIMRRHVSTPRAIGVTLVLVAGRPVADLARGSGFETIAVARAGTQGAVDAWRGRLGRTVDPPPGA